MNPSQVINQIEVYREVLKNLHINFPESPSFQLKETLYNVHSLKDAKIYMRFYDEATPGPWVYELSIPSVLILARQVENMYPAEVFNPFELAELQTWTKRHKLNTAQCRELLEVWRRVHMFKDGDWFASQTYLNTPGRAKVIKSYIQSNVTEVPRTNNWYRLNPIGILILQDLDITWREELNLTLFTS